MAERDEAGLEPLVRVLARLQDVTGQDTNFQFPLIIAVGNESAGKSSILEGIVGRPFLPRGEGIVTRCPIHVRSARLVCGNQVGLVGQQSSRTDIEFPH